MSKTDRGRDWAAWYASVCTEGRDLRTTLRRNNGFTERGKFTIEQVMKAQRESTGIPLLTPWCRVLLETLTGLRLVKKFPAFHGTPRFITARTSVRHLSILGQANPVHITTSHLLEIRTGIPYSFFLTSTLDEVGGKGHTPAALTRE